MLNCAVLEDACRMLNSLPWAGTPDTTCMLGLGVHGLWQGDALTHTCKAAIGALPTASLKRWLLLCDVRSVRPLLSWVSLSCASRGQGQGAAFLYSALLMPH